MPTESSIETPQVENAPKTVVKAKPMPARHAEDDDNGSARCARLWQQQLRPSQREGMRP